ncbi:hypothetical protein [Candidatus Phytoplasma prunorum]|uniref:hypothetical protein n=1 Tax=Candidatus Phytoplasma prunorum TaxID=47565 RepID=UPI002FF1A567
MKNIFTKKFYFLSKFFIILILFLVNYNQNIKIYAAREEKEITKNIDLSINKNLEQEEIKSKQEKINPNNNKKMYAFFEVISSKNKTIPSVNFLSMSELPEASNSQNTNNSLCNEVNLSSFENNNPEIIVATSNNNFKHKKVLKYFLLSTINILFCSTIIFFTTYFI